MRPLIPLLFFVTVAALVPVAVVRSQELPPGPSTMAPLTRVGMDALPDGFEEAQVMTLDFRPGSWTPLHSHSGYALVRVLDGEMTRRRQGVEDSFKPGEGWIEEPGDIHAAGNMGTEPARILVTFLLPRDKPLTTVEGTPSDAPPPGPTPSFQSKRVQLGRTVQGYDEAATTVLGFAPRAETPRHSHGGLTLVGVVDGDMTVRSGGRETNYEAGDLWIEQPGDIHTAGNSASSGNDSRVTVTFLLERGAPVTTLAAANIQPAQVPSVLPRTGDAVANGSVAGVAAFALMVSGAGIYLRRRTRKESRS